MSAEQYEDEYGAVRPPGEGQPAGETQAARADQRHMDAVADAIVAATAQFKNNFESAVAVLRNISETMGGYVVPGIGRLPRSRDERLIVCYAAATATIREGIDGRRQFVIHGPLYNLDGTQNGDFQAVYQAKIFSKSDLFDYPDAPSEPFDRPYRFREDEWTPLLNPTKSKWTFHRESDHVVTGVGLGLARIAVGPGGAAQFWFSTNSFLFEHRQDARRSYGEAASLATAAFNETPALVEGMSFKTTVFHYMSLTRFALAGDRPEQTASVRAARA
jgi:hypothetical protein